MKEKHKDLLIKLAVFIFILMTSAMLMRFGWCMMIDLTHTGAIIAAIPGALFGIWWTIYELTNWFAVWRNQ